MLPRRYAAALDEIAAGVDRELLAAGLGDASSCLFRRCHVLPVPQPGSDLAALRASRVGLQVVFFTPALLPSQPCAASQKGLPTAR